MAIKTKAQILAEIATLFADNNVQAISEADLRTVCNDIVDSYPDSTYSIKVSLTSSQLKNSYSSPVLAIPDPGVGLAIEIISGAAKLNYASVPFSAGVDVVYISTDTADVHQFDDAGGSLLQSTQAVIIKLALNNAISSNQSQIVRNKGVYITLNTADLVAGNSTVDFYFYYRIIEA